LTCVLHRRGSEAADTSLKMARAYWRAKGQASKTRLIGREKGYHGVNFGGISVGGMGGNRKMFGQGSKPTICRTPSRHRFVLQGHARDRRPRPGRPAARSDRPA
jgi:adenosylmethionine-8-amino-7-oxononanoate aminotransferase